MSDEYPIMLDLEPGTYYWCSCAKTQNSPFCDGSHEGTSSLPMEFTITEKILGFLIKKDFFESWVKNPLIISNFLGGEKYE